MPNTICLDQKYSTTRLVTKEKPEIVNNSEDKFETVLFLPEGEGRKGEGGLRKKGYFKKSYEDKPLISIITVVFNGEKYLEETILSVINQSYDNVEYIVIDGGSTDGTLDIIKKYEDKIDYWVSEKDEGIYDAMNKGIAVASQDAFLMWINAGDKLNDIHNFVDEYEKDIFIYFFSVFQENINKNLTKWNISKINSINEKNIICPQMHHQGFIVSKKIITKIYDLKYTLLADRFFMSEFINNVQFKKKFIINKYISIYDLGGLSDNPTIERVNEYFMLSKDLQLNFLKVILLNNKCIVKLLLKVFLPYPVIALIRKIKYKAAR